MKISTEMEQYLQCPKSKAKLEVEGSLLKSVIDPSIQYPVLEGIPILINNENSLFSIEDFITMKNTTFDLKENNVRRLVKKYMPKISHNIKSRKNYAELLRLLPVNSKILIIGGSIKGQGMDDFYASASIEIIGSDVSFGPYTTVINDAHDIPFKDETFDCVIAQAVLEHVLDPHRCVNEIFRVLKPTGLIYAETPFIQQVHMKQYDYTRFTHLGHRRLFRNFEEIKSGPCCGPGMALAWSYTWFLRSFAISEVMVSILTLFAYLTSFFIKYFDYILIDKPGSYDAASAFFFMGRKSTSVLSDQDLIRSFKGIH